MVYYILIAALAYGVFGRTGTVYGKGKDPEQENVEEEKKEADISSGEDDASEIVVEDRPQYIEEASADLLAVEPEPTVIYKDWSDLYDALDQASSESEQPDESMSIMDFLPQDTEEEKTEEEPEEVMYSFVSNNIETNLNMRDGPDLTDTVIHKLKPGSKGVVLKLGEDWSYVTADGCTGYCSNEFLTMKEVTKEEYESLKSEAEEAGKGSASRNKTEESPSGIREAGQSAQMPLINPEAMQMPVSTDGLQIPVGTDGAVMPASPDSTEDTSDSPDDDTETSLDTEETTDGIGSVTAAP